MHRTLSGPGRIALVAAWLAAPASAFADPGSALFDAAGCRACHKIGERGGNSGPDLTLVGFRRGRPWLDLWLAAPSAWKHDTLMPDFRLRLAERAALVDFLSVQTGQAWAGRRPWNAASERAARGPLIFSRAGCVACHGAEGRGGHPNNNVPGERIPALSGAAQAYAADELERRIARGSRPEPADVSAPPPLVAMPAWEKALSGDEIHDVAAYLLTLSPAAAASESW